MLGSPFLSGNVIVQGPSWDLLWHAYAVDQSTLDADTDLNRDRPTKKEIPPSNWYKTLINKKV